MAERAVPARLKLVVSVPVPATKRLAVSVPVPATQLVVKDSAAQSVAEVAAEGADGAADMEGGALV